MAGDRETGVSVIRLVHELDAGPIAAQERFPIAAGDDAGQCRGDHHGSETSEVHVRSPPETWCAGMRMG